MRWYRASHFSHVSASPPGGSRSAATTGMRSSNGGWPGSAGLGFPGIPGAGAGLRADDGANSVSDAGSSLVTANLRLAKLRSVSEFSGAEGFSLVLATEARRPAVRRHRCALQADQAGRAARRRRRVSAALIEGGQGRARAEPTEAGNFFQRSWWARCRLARATSCELCYPFLIERKGRTSMVKQKPTSRAAARTAAPQKS